MRKILKRSLLALLVLFGIVQLARPSRSNPPVDPAREITTVHPAPQAVSLVLQRSCNDCHSNRTAWPWYSNVAPVSWLIARDVNNGREVLNVSDWGAYSAEKQQDLVGKMCGEIKDGEMPTFQYTLLHASARVSAADVQALCSWTQQISPGTTEAKEDKD